MDSLGDWIRERREDLRMTQKDLAKKVHMSHSTISRIERGEDVSISCAEHILNFFGGTLVVGKGSEDISKAKEVVVWHKKPKGKR